MLTSRLLFSFCCFLILIGFFSYPVFAGPENDSIDKPPICGEGTILNNEGVCVTEVDQEIVLIIIGLVVTGVVSGVGFIFTAVETKAARNERNLSMVGGFTSQISSLKDKERNLNTKKDCEVYAQNFVDLMDQIAYLRLKGTIPTIVTKFFENDFAYALTMIIWLKVNEDKIKKKTKSSQTKAAIPQSKNKIITEDLYEKKNGKEWLDTLSLTDEKNDEFTWSSLIELCKTNEDGRILQLEKDALPPAMLEDYDQLPEEEIDAAIEMVKGYSEQISSMKEKEQNLKTKKDCEVYALNYVDLMDQIAFLYLKNMFPTDLSKYFENEFAYALTMIRWLNNNEIISDSKAKIDENDKESWKNYFDSLSLTDEKGDEFTWSSLLGWCREGKNCIQPLPKKELPPIMKEDYHKLPDETVDNSLEIIKDYGERLTLITEKEEKIKVDDVLGCELYINSYLDLVDGIAFLYHQKVIPKKIAQFFENNFCYAMTLYLWLLDKKLAKPITIKKIKEPLEGDREISLEELLIEADLKKWTIDKNFTWTDMMEWCEEEKLEPFEEDQLPPNIKKMNVPKSEWLEYYK